MTDEVRIDDQAAKAVDLVAVDAVSRETRRLETKDGAPAGAEHGLLVRQVGAIAAAVTGTVTANCAQTTSPWVVSGAVTCTQTTSPWVVSGTATVTQGTAAAATSPWMMELSDGAAVYTAAKTGQFPTALSTNGGIKTGLTDVGGTAVSAGSGTINAGCQRVCLPTDQPAVPVTPASNSTVDLNKVAGTTTSVNTGHADAGTQRVTIADDQFVPVNVSRFDGNAIALGFGGPSAGALRVMSPVANTPNSNPFSTVVYPQNGTTADLSPIIMALTHTGNGAPGSMATGDLVFGTGVPVGATILTVDSDTQITLNVNCTADGTTTITVLHLLDNSASRLQLVIQSLSTKAMNVYLGAPTDPAVNIFWQIAGGGALSLRAEDFVGPVYGCYADNDSKTANVTALTYTV